MKVRLAKPEEAGTAVEWLRSTPENLFDPEVLGYPSTMTLCVENGQPEFFMPMQNCFFLESIGKRPGIRHRDMLLALVEMVKSVRHMAKEMKVAEIYFFCRDSSINVQAPHFGFELICEDKDRQVSLFRMRTQCASTAT